MASLSIKRGRTEVLRSTITPASLVADPSVIYFTAKKWASDDDNAAVINKDSNSNGIEVTDADAGTIEITIDSDDTRTLENTDSRLLYEISIENGGDSYDIDSGALYVLEEAIQHA